LKKKCTTLKSEQILRNIGKKKVGNKIPNNYYYITENVYTIPNLDDCQLSSQFYYGIEKVCCSKEATNMKECLDIYNDIDYKNPVDLENKICTMNKQFSYNHNNNNIIIPKCIIKTQEIFKEPSVDNNQKIVVKLLGKNIKEAQVLCNNLKTPPFSNITKQIQLNKNSKYYISPDSNGILDVNDCPKYPAKGELVQNISNSNDNQNIIKNGIYQITNEIYDTPEDDVYDNDNTSGPDNTNELDDIDCIGDRENIKYVINEYESPEVNKERLIYYNSILNSDSSTLDALNSINNNFNINLKDKSKSLNKYNSDLITKSQIIYDLNDKNKYNTKITDTLKYTLGLLFIILIFFLIYNFIKNNKNKIEKTLNFFKKA